MATASPTRIAALVERHRAFCAELDLDADAVLGERLAALQALAADARAGERTLDWQAEVLAQGELLSSTLGAAYLRTQGLDFGWCDARDWLDAVSLPNAERLGAAAVGELPARRPTPASARASRAQPAPMLITQGFIARHGDGGTAILGRGGSDTSAAYFGALLKAQRVEIWTDVPGMFSANPRDVPDARLLTRLRLRRGAGNRHHRRQGAAPALDRAVPRRRRADGDPRHRAPRPAGHAHRRAARRPCRASRRSAAATASCWCRWKPSACGSRSASSPTCSSASSATACRST